MSDFKVGDTLTRASGVEEVYQVVKVHDGGTVDLKHLHTLDSRGEVIPHSKTGFVYTQINTDLMQRFEA